MARPILHFAHANAYPAGTYRLFLDRLHAHYEVGALDLHAHNPRYPVKDGWRELAQELVDELVGRYDRPVILAGHSMGGILCLLAANARPDLVRCVVLLDAPVVAGWRALAWQIVKLIGTDKKFSPAKVSEMRRVSWADSESVHKYFAMRKPFTQWHPEVLQDYVKHGFVPHMKGMTLRFNRETETAVYRTIPHCLGKLARKTFPTPVGFIGGSHSEECRLAGLRATKRIVGKHFVQVEGGHLFPMESPVPAATAVHEMIQALLQNKHHS